MQMRPNLNFAGSPPGRAGEIGGNGVLAIDVDEHDRAAEIFAKHAEDGRAAEAHYFEFAAEGGLVMREHPGATGA